MSARLAALARVLLLVTGLPLHGPCLPEPGASLVDARN